MHVPGTSARVPWNGHEPGGGGQSTSVGIATQVARGGDEFGPRIGPIPGSDSMILACGWDRKVAQRSPPGLTTAGPSSPPLRSVGAATCPRARRHQRVPSPTAYLLGALAGCAVAFSRDTLAPQFDVELTNVSATGSCSADLGGLLGIDGTRPNLADLRVEISNQYTESPRPGRRPAVGPAGPVPDLPRPARRQRGRRELHGRGVVLA